MNCSVTENTSAGGGILRNAAIHAWTDYFSEHLLKTGFITQEEKYRLDREIRKLRGD